MQVATKILFYFALMTSLAACGGSGSDNTATESLLWKEQQATTNYKLDILWVIDSTSSMAATQAELASSMDAVFAKMISLRLDFKMSAITMDMRSHVQNSEGRLMGDPRVLDLDTWNLQEAFSKLVQPSLSDFADSKALDALSSSFSYENLEGIHTFLREDAMLAVIFVSDQQDESLLLLEQMQSTLDRFKPKFLKQAWVSHSITADCGFSGSMSLKQLSQQSNGLGLDLCEGMSATLEKIQERNLELVTEINLQSSVDPAQLRVTVNGIEVPNQLEHGWLYRPESHSIRFYGASQPAADAIVKILTAGAR